MTLIPAFRAPSIKLAVRARSARLSSAVPGMDGPSTTVVWKSITRSAERWTSMESGVFMKATMPRIEASVQSALEPHAHPGLDGRMLRSLHENLWVCEQPFGFFGLQVGARMTVIRIAGGDLLLHSPIAPTAELRAEVEALGPVKFLMAPNS